MIISGQPISDEDFKSLHETVNAPSNAVKYLSIDPGKANGVCGFDSRYYLQFMYTVREEDMQRFLECFEAVTLCIVEDFKLYPNKSQQQIYSDMLTSRVIGRIEGWAARHRVELIKQGASIKKNGYAWIGKKPPSKSDPTNHMKDAHVHFMYWAIKNRRIDASVLLDLNKE